MYILQISENVKHATAICHLIPRDTDVSHPLLFLCATFSLLSVAAKALFLSMPFDLNAHHRTFREECSHTRQWNHISCLNPVCVCEYCVFEYVCHLKSLFNLLPFWVIFDSYLQLSLRRLFLHLTLKTH